MQILKNYLYNIFYQIFILLVPIVTTPYLARVIGPTGVGINSYTNATIQYFILFGSIGINLYGNRQVAFVRNNRELLTQTFYEIYILRIISIILAYLAFLIFLLFTSRFQVYYWAQSVSLIAAAFDISWFFMGVENFAVTVLRNFIVKIITVISILTLVRSYSDLTLYIFILSISLLIGNLTLFPNLKSYIGKPNLKSMNIFHHIRPAVILFIPQIATQIYLVLNKSMIGLISSVRAAGYFDQSDKIVKITLAIVTATGTVMLPHVANAFANGEYQKTKNYLYKSFSFVSAISIPMFFGLLAIANKFIPLFLTAKFNEVIPIIMVESVVIWLIAWSNAIGTQYLLPTNQSKAYSISVILGAIINLLCNIPLIILWGALGASIATVISEVTVTSYQLWAIRRQVNFHKLFFETYKYFLSGLLMFIVVIYINKLLPSSWLILIMEIIIGIIVYVIALFILRASIFSNLKELISVQK
ncbi:flippase [Lentilactobacillus buchneri]|uniref:oligosaccharide flippase family protein n=1 Tax=Lentilactobacillus buchneri TaxID=1581 RepID=UPI0021A82FF1|nr:polysaccharide biosynthesis C-terminal domain-containing protein [Lentilactobacillus buchneri]MCT3543728.1 flippase [Lentilactobacillus buchneri]